MFFDHQIISLQSALPPSKLFQMCAPIAMILNVTDVCLSFDSFSHKVCGMPELTNVDEDEGIVADEYCAGGSEPGCAERALLSIQVLSHVQS
jgi:hypothetical protein